MADTTPIKEVNRMKPDTSVDISGVEFVREYGPDVRAYKLTDFGLARLEANQLPPKMAFRSYGMVRLLKRLEIAEEDELADYMGLPLEEVRRLLKRLSGYGYIEVVGTNSNK